MRLSGPRSILLLLAALFGVGPSPLWSAGVGTSADNFLKIGIGARPAAMGQAYLALADDAEAMNWNPAGLSQLEEPEISAMHLAWIGDINYEYVGYAMPWHNQGFGLGVTWLNVAPFNSTADPTAQPGSAQDFSGVLAWGFPLTPQLSLGAAARTIFSDLASSSSFGAALDAGAMLKPFGRSFSLALVAQNLGAVSGFDSVSDPLPVTLKMGAAWRIYDGRRDNVANLVADATKSLDNRLQYNLGGEWWLFQPLALRAGYKLAEGGQDFSTQLSDFSNIANVTAGFGIRLDAAELDYAFEPFGELGFTHRFSLSWRFGFEPRAVKPETLLSSPPRFEGGGGGPQVAFNVGLPKGIAGVKDWKIDILDPRGRVLRTLGGQGSPPANLAWNGTDDRGRPVNRDQPLRYRFEVRDWSGRASEAEGTIAQEIRPKDFLAAGPQFDPGLGGLVFKPKTGITVGVKQWTLDIKAPDGTLIKTISGQGAIPKSLVFNTADLSAPQSNLIASKGGVSEIRYALEFKDASGKSKVVSDMVRFAAGQARQAVAAASLPLPPRDFKVNPGREVLVVPLANLTSPDPGLAASVPFVMRPPTNRPVRNWKFDITAPDGRLVKSYSGVSPLPDDLFWDGRDSNGLPVPEAARCRYSLWVMDSSGKAATTTRRSPMSQPFRIRTAQGNIRKMSGLWFRVRGTGLLPEVRARLDRIAALIKANPDVQVTIQGHSADEGGPEEDLRLSQERADSVLRYLIEDKGVSPRNITAIGYGDTMPLDSSGTPEAAQRNRRVDVLLISRE